jgi:hypothetical protein
VKLGRAIATGCISAFLCLGCYVYRPVGALTLAPGAEIRAQLTPPGTFRLGELTVSEVEGVEGQVSKANGDSLLIWGTWLRTRIGSRYHANHGLLALDRQQVGALQVRRFSASRTVLAGVAGAGILYALFRLADAALGGDGAGGGGTDPF